MARTKKELDLDGWLRMIAKPRQPKNVISVHFPTDQLYHEFISRVSTFPEDTIKTVLERLLIPSASLGVDELNFKYLLKDTESLVRKLSHSYFRRLLRYGLRGRARRAPPWEGITWVLDLLPEHPKEALEGLDAYFLAHIQILPDARWNGLSDALGIIRARYIGVPGTQPERIALINQLPSRDFEHLVGALYKRMGFETSLTAPSKDGGRDIEAIKKSPGELQSIFIECKRYTQAVGVEFVNRLLGIVSYERRTKGVLVTTSRFTKGAIRFAARNPRLELIDGNNLVVMLNKYLGALWPIRLDQIVIENKSTCVETQESS